MPRRVPIQIHTVGVLAGTRMAPIWIELVNKPPDGASGRRDRPQPMRDRFARGLVAVNTAHYENASSGGPLANDVSDDRPPEDRSADYHHSNGVEAPTRRAARA